MKIIPVEFDSGLIAPKVGMFCLEEGSDYLDSNIIKKIKKEEYNLVYLKSKFPLNTKAFNFFGSLDTYEVGKSRFIEIIKNGENEEVSKMIFNFDGQSWPEIEKLLKFSSPTRFRKDKKISSSAAVAQKLKSLKKYQNEFPNLFKVIKDEEGIHGLVCCYIENSRLNLYEVILDDSKLTPMVLGPLYIAITEEESVDRLELIRTQIYAENYDMIRFCKRLGFYKVDSDFYYHYWPRD